MGGTPTWRHERTGGVYATLMTAERESDHEPMLVYRSVDDGTVWVRPAEEFFDGRFKRV